MTLLKCSFVIIMLILTSCDWAKQKTKETVHKTGEVVAKTGSEFADGVVKGVEKTFQNKVVFSEKLTQLGVSTGKIIISSTDTSTDNILTAYMVFNNDINEKITVKVFSETGQEYGRVSKIIKATKDEARYVDFVFDRRTNIDSRGHISFE